MAFPGKEDREVLRDCLDVRPGAWEAFVSHFSPYLAQVCRSAMARSALPCGPQEVEDMLQEVFLLLLENDRRALRAYRGQSSLVSYLASVAVHRIAKEEAPVPPVPSGDRLSGMPGPEEIVQAREALEMLGVERDRLPSRARLALALQGDGASLREVGQALGISEDAAAKLLSRSKAQLRERLKENR